MMKSTIHWVASAGMALTAETGSGHLLNMDGAPEGGGRNLAARPMEVLLSGAGGCTTYDVVLILKKSNQQVTQCEVRCEAERAETDPKIFTKIHFHFVLTGRALKEHLVAHAVKVSQEKYCSASIMLSQVAQITHSYEVHEAP